RLKSLRVDGGAAANNLLMQFQADILGTDVVRPAMTETTALGAAFMAGLGTGFWSMADLVRLDRERDTVTFRPAMDEDARRRLLAGWGKAVERRMGWADE